MRASAKPSSAGRGPAGTSAAGDPSVVVVARRRLPRPVVWLLWLLGALLGSVVLGFLAGLARPRDPDPWTASPARPSPSADPGPPASKED